MNNNCLYDFLSKNRKNDITKIAIKTEKFSITYKKFFDEVTKVAEYLKKNTYNSRCKIGIQIKSHAAFLAVYLAGIKNESVIVPIYANIGSEKCKRVLKELNINIFITEKVQNIFEIKGDLFRCMEEELLLYEVADHEDDVDEDIVMIMQTSGTTNESKGVMLSVDNIISNIISISNYLKLRENDKVLIIKNTNHISTIVGEMLVALYEGVTMVFEGNVIRINHLSKVINENNITVFFAVPSILHGMLEQESDIEQCLRIVNFYGAKIAQNDIKKLLNKFPYVNFIYSYGQTEASPRVTYIERNALEKYLGSSGKAINGVTVTIRDEAGNVLKPNKEGEIVVEGPNVMRGYYNNETLTKRTIKMGKLFTGDLGYMNDEGYLYVTGRKDNMVIVSGKSVHPEEVEDVIIEYPGVSEVLVSEKCYGRVNGLVCHIVCQNAKKVDAKHLLHFVKERVEDYKVPREVIAVSALEKTSSGKIKRHKC